jgi:hypothetical protein
MAKALSLIGIINEGEKENNRMIGTAQICLFLKILGGNDREQKNDPNIKGRLRITNRKDID